MSEKIHSLIKYLLATLFLVLTLNVTGCSGSSSGGASSGVSGSAQ